MHGVSPWTELRRARLAEACYLCRIAASSLRSVTRSAHSLVVGAVDPENLVVGAGHQRIAGFVVGLVALPDRDPLEPDDRGFVVFRHRHVDAAAIAIDAAAEADFIAGVFGDDVAAIAAGVEIAGPVAIFDAKPERIIGGVLVRRNFRRHQQLHRADLLLGMPRQMIGIVAAHEAGIGLLAGRPGEHPDVEGVGLGLVDAFLLGVAGGDPDCRGRQHCGDQCHDREGCFMKFPAISDTPIDRPHGKPIGHRAKGRAPNAGSIRCLVAAGAGDVQRARLCLCDPLR